MVSAAGTRRGAAGRTGRVGSAAAGGGAPETATGAVIHPQALALTELADHLLGGVPVSLHPLVSSMPTWWASDPHRRWTGFRSPRQHLRGLTRRPGHSRNNGETLHPVSGNYAGGLLSSGGTLYRVEPDWLHNDRGKRPSSCGLRRSAHRATGLNSFAVRKPVSCCRRSMNLSSTTSNGWYAFCAEIQTRRPEGLASYSWNGY